MIEKEGSTKVTRISTKMRTRTQNALPFLALAMLYIVMVVVSPGYLDPAQISGIFQLAAILGVVAVGQTLVILVAGIDLSVGAVATLTNLSTAAVLAGTNANLPKALGIAIIIGAAVGAFNGIIISWLRVPDLVATLATMSIVIGIGYLSTSGSPKGASAPMLNSFVTSRFLGIVTGVLLLWVILAVVTIFVLRRTVFGRQIYAVGLNREAAAYAGVRVPFLIFGLYLISGITAALAGFLLTGYTGSSFLGSGTSYQMASIAAVILGGTSMFGGKGGYGGTVAGVLITVMLTSLLRVVGIAQAGQNIAYGVVILVMLVLFASANRKR